ncbi:MAG: sugar phosphate isomerase/epimerase [Clostridiales bacterium]|jgi:sugar phosphate isomerase/epimerase|nr:sugar phosphate isomerase/epimerase [Clostridiales bacterium]
MAKFMLSSFADEAAKPFSEQIRISLKNGITYMEIRTIDGKNISAHTAGECKELKKILDENGMGISAIGSPYGKINVHEDFAPHLEAFKRTVECAHILGAKQMRIFSFYIDENKVPEDYEDLVLERLEQFLINACGILCVHENEKGIFGDDASRSKKIADAFDGKIKLVFDPANFVQCGQDTLKAYDILENDIEYLHVKDSLAASKAVVPAGRGDGNVKEILRRFSRKEGERFLVVEPHLKVFSGFEALESAVSGSAPLQEFSFRSNEEAFDAAVEALKSILRDIA